VTADKEHDIHFIFSPMERLNMHEAASDAEKLLNVGIRNYK